MFQLINHKLVKDLSACPITHIIIELLALPLHCITLFTPFPLYLRSTSSCMFLPSLSFFIHIPPFSIRLPLLPTLSIPLTLSFSFYFLPSLSL